MRDQSLPVKVNKIPFLVSIIYTRQVSNVSKQNIFNYKARKEVLKKAKEFLDKYESGK